MFVENPSVLNRKDLEWSLTTTWGGGGKLVVILVFSYATCVWPEMYSYQ